MFRCIGLLRVQIAYDLREIVRSTTGIKKVSKVCSYMAQFPFHRTAQGALLLTPLGDLFNRILRLLPRKHIKIVDQCML